MKIIFFVLLSLQLFAQEVLYYNCDIKIDVKSGIVSVEGFADLDFKGCDSVDFVLYKNSSISEIKGRETEINYYFDTVSASPVMYIPDGRKLTIKRIKGSSERQSLLFKYIIDASRLSGWAKSFTENWIELNYYSAWFPVGPGRKHKSEFRILIDSNYSVTGSGIVSKKDKYWLMVQPWESFDNVIIASKTLESKIFLENSARIQTEYNTPDFPSSDADSIQNECRFVFTLFEELFGKKDSTYLKFVIAPFEKGGGYSRKNFVRMGTKNFNLYTRQGIAHEIAHFWWNNAVTTTWEDWLNEAFAEYSMFLYVRKRLGTEEFQKEVGEYKSRTQNLPPLWGIDRNAPESYSVLYEKGALILCEFEEKTGTDPFINFLKEAADKKISSTDDLLKLIEKMFSSELRLWLENKLKNA